MKKARSLSSLEKPKDLASLDPHSQAISWS